MMPPSADRIERDASAVTVVVITRDRPGEARRAVGRLLRLPDGVQVIVIDNGSAGPSGLDGLRHPRLRVAHLDRNLGAAARNLGVRCATTRHVAFADDDSAWVPGSLTLAARLLDRHDRLALIAGRILVGDERRVDPVCEEMARSPLPSNAALPGVPVLGFVACAAVVRRDAFLATGGFDRRYGVGGEERPVAIALAAAGWELAYVPACTALHWPSAQRDPERRRRVVVRNDLWSTWSHRRWTTALAATVAAIRSARTDPAARAGLRDALAAAGSVLRRRRPVGRELERRLRLLDAAASAAER
jgi:GT2 family glycosyltransferase